MDLPALRTLLGGHLIHRGPYLEGPEPHDWRQEHGEALALLLECSGKGRHWLNVTDSPTKALGHHLHHKQVLGLARHRDDFAVLLKAITSSPEATASVCEACAARGQPSPVPAPVEQYFDMSAWRNLLCCGRGRKVPCSCAVCTACPEHGTRHYGKHD